MTRALGQLDLLDHATCYAAASIAGWISFVVVLSRVYHERRAIRAIDRIRLTLFQRDEVVHDFDGERPIGGDMQIRHIPRMVAF